MPTVPLLKTVLILFPLAAGPIVHEILIIKINKTKIDQICSTGPDPEIFRAAEYYQWKKSLYEYAKYHQINIQGGLSADDAAKLRVCAHSYKATVISHTGYPFSYPYSGIWAPRISLYLKGKLVAISTDYITYSDIGPLLTSISGGGATYKCRNSRSDFRPELNGFSIPIFREIRWSHGDLK